MIRIDGTRIGQFAGLNEGDTVAAAHGIALAITYLAGDGNDIALQAIRVPEPATVALIGTGAMVASRRRAR